MLAFEPDPPFFKQFDDMGNVVRSAGNTGADQPACRIHAEFFVLDDSRGVELLGQVTGGEFVRSVEALTITQKLVNNAVHDRTVLPTESGGLFAPDVSFVGLHLAETPLGAGVPQDVHLVLGRQAVPVEAMVGRIGLRFVEDLLAPFAERLAYMLGNRQHDYGLLVRVVADTDAEPPQLVGQHGLEISPELLHAGIGQRPGVE